MLHPASAQNRKDGSFRISK